MLDFELEVGAVIGRSGQDLTPKQARGHIVGCLVFNDWSARDLQKPEKNLGLGFSKGKDFANTLGPYLVTADEVEDRRDRDGFLDLEMTVTLNGELIGRDTLANISWTFEEKVAYAARDAWVHPGDILGSGTCGWGALAEFWGRVGERTPPPLQPGDTVTLSSSSSSARRAVIRSKSSGSSMRRIVEGRSTTSNSQDLWIKPWRPPNTMRLASSFVGHGSVFSHGPGLPDPVKASVCVVEPGIDQWDGDRHGRQGH